MLPSLTHLAVQTAEWEGVMNPLLARMQEGQPVQQML